MTAPEPGWPRSIVTCGAQPASTGSDLTTSVGVSVYPVLEDAYPFWSLIIIAMDVVALYGLCAYGSRENVTA